MQNHKTICHILNGFPLGGKEKLLVDLCQSKPSSLNYIVVIINNLINEELLSQLKSSGVAVYQLNRNLKGSNLIYIYKLYVLLYKLNVDIINTHDCFSLIYSVVAAFFLKTKIIVTVHTNNFLESRVPVSLVKIIFKFLVKKIVFISLSTRQSLFKQIEFDFAKSVVISNGILVSNFNKCNNKLFSFTLLCVGRLIPSIKGQDVLLKAIKIVLTNKFPVRCRIVGSGPGLHELSSLAVKLGVHNNVEFCGANLNVASFYSSSDLFVLPSIREGFGIVILEAMASGLPVIASNTGGPSEIIQDQKNGLLFNVGDECDLAEKIMLLFKDNLLRNMLVQNGLTGIDKYDINNISIKYESLYRSVIKSLIFLLLFIFCSVPSYATKYVDYVRGSDNNPGTFDLPLKTLDNTNWSFIDKLGNNLSWQSDNEWLLNSCVEHYFSGNIRASGTPSSPVIISSYGNCGQATVNANNATACMIFDNKHNIKLSNINFIGIGDEFGEGLRIFNSSNIHVDNCEFLGISGNQRGIWIFGKSFDCVINNSRFKSLQTGILATEFDTFVPKRLLISNSLFLNIINGDMSGADGIAFGLTSKMISSDYDFARIDNNCFFNIADQAIDVCGANNVIISNNYIDCGIDHLKGDGDGIKLGIDLPYTFGLYLFNNFITNVKNDFIYAGSAAYTLINNTFKGAGRNGVTHSNYTRKVYILNNIFSNIGLSGVDSFYYEKFPFKESFIDFNMYYSENVSNVYLTNGFNSFGLYQYSFSNDRNSMYGVNPLISNNAFLNKFSPAIDAGYSILYTVNGSFAAGDVRKSFKSGKNIGAFGINCAPN